MKLTRVYLAPMFLSLALLACSAKPNGGTSPDSNAATDGNPASSLNADAVAFGKSLFAKGMVTCGGKTFMKLTSSGGGGAQIPGEIRNPTFELDPLFGNSAGKGDNLNGVDFKGAVDMHWEAYRFYFNHRWSDWLNGNDAPAIPSVLNAESVNIVHKNGQWLHDPSYEGTRDFAGLRPKPLTCAEIPGG